MDLARQIAAASGAAGPRRARIASQQGSAVSSTRWASRAGRAWGLCRRVPSSSPLPRLCPRPGWPPGSARRPSTAAAVSRGR
jgi:hypothetical protein